MIYMKLTLYVYLYPPNRNRSCRAERKESGNKTKKEKCKMELTKVNYSES